MAHLIDDMINPDCYQACIRDQEEECTVEREIKIACDTVFAQEADICDAACSDVSEVPEGETAECTVPSPRILNCYELVNTKNRIRRRIDALETATLMYLNTGSLSPKTHYNIAPGERNCKQSYHPVLFNDEKLDDAEQPTGSTWSDIAQGYIEVNSHATKFFVEIFFKEKMICEINFRRKN